MIERTRAFLQWARAHPILTILAPFIAAYWIARYWIEGRRESGKLILRQNKNAPSGAKEK